FTSLLKAHGIEAAFVIAGSNQDASLGYAYTTPGAEDFFLERCRADTDAIIGHFKTHIYNRSSLASVTEVFETEKLGKGKGKERSHDDFIRRRRSDWASGRHGQTWASGKLLPWKHLPQKLAQNALVCENWPEVLFPGQERSSRSKPKGISDLTIVECSQIVAATRDNGPHKLQFRFDPYNKADLSTSRKPVIIGAPPPYDSKLTHAMRLFSNGKIDYNG
ncbi:hypothetical protein SCLCIDRAFT_90312, partial [Scleroderma citrinum Foug A]